MADRVFIIPLRNDLAGVGLNLGDLRPNAGQRNSIYEGTPQNVYVAEMLDVPGATTVSGVAYISGSLSTTLTADAVVDDTTGGGNDVTAMQATTFGLASYLKDRVQGGGTASAIAPQMPFADCNTVALQIMARVLAGQDIALSNINTLLSAAVADTDLDGAAALSKSFGTVSDILRILSGEIYRLPLLSIVESQVNRFLDLAARQVIVAAQTAAMVAAQGQFYASGAFLDPTDAGYRACPSLVPTGAFNISNAAGVIAGYKGNITVLRREFAYSAGAVTAFRPRALLLGTGNVAATGIGPAIEVYNHLGVAL